MAKARRLSTEEYFQYPETTTRMELVFGVVREPPAPRWGHQTVVTRLTALLEPFVRDRGLGRVCVSPVDVVLDVERALIVQPDIVFISTGRMSIVRDRIFGAPDLTIEVLSLGTVLRDRTVKLDWYRRYGVRESWLVDAPRQQIEVIDLAARGEPCSTFEKRDRIRSSVIGDLPFTVASIFE
ncbi:MAG TPA: Uma2 family endonuclease [Vicinamibacterales bacterium]|nr:Uma2 family endonuclease [Vicinamibacterales bacterium]